MQALAKNFLCVGDEIWFLEYPQPQLAIWKRNEIDPEAGPEVGLEIAP